MIRRSPLACGDARIIRARAPLRLGLAGGGTDVVPYCNEFGGYVLNATIDMHAYAMIEPWDNGKVEFAAADLGLFWAGDAVAQLDTRGDLGLHRAVYNRIIRDFNQGEALSMRLTTFSDAPAGSGLGSSSTLVVAMIKAFQEMLSLPLGEYETAHLAYEIERIDMGLSGGKQDQYAATFGGFNFMEFYAADRVIVNPLRIKSWIISELEASTLLAYTGISRDSSEIIEEQRRNVECGQQAAIDAMHEVKEESLVMKESLLKGDFEMLIECVRKGWTAKKLTAKNISNTRIEQAFETALEAGTKAGKVSGAGGGGFMMLFVEPSSRMHVSRALGAIGCQVINCHFTKYGTQSWKVG